MDVKQHDSETKGRFYLEHDGKEVAAMHYVYAGPKSMIIDHTEVAEAFEGRGLGKELLAALVSFARKQQIKVIPLCPFAKAVFDKVAAYQDVLA